MHLGDRTHRMHRMHRMRFPGRLIARRFGSDQWKRDSSLAWLRVAAATANRNEARQAERCAERCTDADDATSTGRSAGNRTAQPSGQDKPTWQANRCIIKTTGHRALWGYLKWQHKIHSWPTSPDDQSDRWIQLPKRIIIATLYRSSSWSKVNKLKTIFWKRLQLCNKRHTKPCQFSTA